MKSKLFQVLMLVAVLLAVSMNAFSQTQPTSTTLSAAISDERTTRFTVASATGFVASTNSLDYGVFIDREFMRITAVSGTTITVQRAQAATRASTHRSGARVVVGRYGSSAASGTDAGGPFIQSAPNGSCTVTNYPFMPLIQVNANATGGQAIYSCQNSQWVKNTLPEDVPMTFTRYCTVPSGALAALNLVTSFSTAGGFGFGTNTTPVAGTVYYGTLELPRTMWITGLSALNGQVAATDVVRLQIYRADGVSLGNTALAGATASGFWRFQDQDLVTAVLAPGPARYWISYQTNGTTTRFVSVPAPISAAQTTATTGMIGSSFTGGLSTAAAIGNLIGTASALPTTAIGDTIPVACVYGPNTTN